MIVKIPVKYTVSFVVDYVIKYIINKIESSKNDSRLNDVGSNFGFNAYEALLYIAQNLLVDIQDRYITVSVNKNIHWHGYNLEKLLDIITYGSRDVKGCTIYWDTVKFINEHYKAMYLKYLGGV